MLIACIFDLEFQGRNLLNCMGILFGKYVLHVVLSMICIYLQEQNILSLNFCAWSGELASLTALIFMWLAYLWCHLAFLLSSNLNFYSNILWRYVRDFEVETVGMKETSRRCSDAQCRAKLTDSVLDWEVIFWFLLSIASFEIEPHFFDMQNV